MRTTFYLTLVHAVAILLFSNGFLLSRSVLPDVSTEVYTSARFNKVIILVIDALRYDFTVPQNEDRPWCNKLTILHELSKHENAFLTRFIAHPPTTTLQRLKGLTTGSLPTFVDAGSNFAGDAITEDNLIYQLNAANKSIAFVGDDTWQALFPHAFMSTKNYPFESLKVYDLDTVDNGVHHHLFDADDAFLKSDDWDVVISHALGLDHSGHRYGPDHSETTRKLLEMNDWIERLVDQINDDTVLVVFGDHGMNKEGDHGGDSYDELNAALFMYSKFAQFTSGPAVNQIDLVPTLALLLGLPIPFNNLGSPIPQAFDDLYEAIESTTRTTKKYISHYEGTTVGDELQSITATGLMWQREVLSIFERQWAQYDLVSITLGLLLMLSSILTSTTRLPTYINSIICVSALLLATPWTNYMPHFSQYTFTLPWTHKIACLVVISLFPMETHNERRLTWKVIPHLLIFASNSFLIHEDRIALYLGNLFILIEVARAVRSSKLILLVVMLASRFVIFFLNCREEQGIACGSYKQGLPDLIFFCVLGIFICFVALRDYLRKYGCWTPYSMTMTGGFIITLILGTIYWINDKLSASLTSQLYLARFIFFFITVQCISWFYLPVSVTVYWANRATIRSQGSSRTYVILLMPLIGFIIYLGKGQGFASLCILFAQLLLLQGQYVSPMIYVELAHLHFFTTGHQMALPYIKWDLAYLLTTEIRTPLSHLMIILNAFGPFIMASFFMDMQIFFAMITFSTMVFATHFRRHLMVWKIFAPRFMCAAFILLVVDASTLLMHVFRGRLENKYHEWRKVIRHEIATEKLPHD